MAGAAIFGEGRDQPRSISSSVLPLVSGVNFQTNRTVRIDMAAYVQKAPVTVCDKKVNVSPRHAIHRLIVAMDIARPRMRVGNSSDIMTQTPSLSPTARQATQARTRYRIGTVAAGSSQKMRPSKNSVMAMPAAAVAVEACASYAVDDGQRRHRR